MGTDRAERNATAPRDQNEAANELEGEIEINPQQAIAAAEL